MKRLSLLLLFLIITPLNLGISLLSLQVINHTKQTALAKGVLRQQTNNSSLTYAALPEPVGQILGAVTVSDARPVIIKKYLEKYDSPMAPYAGLIVDTSDKKGLDWRLLVAIAQQESNLGKKVPENSYNPFGWGIHSQGTLHFSSWEEAIETVAFGIKEKYIDKGFVTPDEIMAKYTPNSTGSWASGVNQFIEELETGQVD